MAEDLTILRAVRQMIVNSEHLAAADGKLDRGDASSREAQAASLEEHARVAKGRYAGLLAGFTEKDLVDRLAAQLAKAAELATAYAELEQLAASAKEDPEQVQALRAKLATIRGALDVPDRRAEQPSEPRALGAADA